MILIILGVVVLVVLVLWRASVVISDFYGGVLSDED